MHKNKESDFYSGKKNFVCELYVGTMEGIVERGEKILFF